MPEVTHFLWIDLETTGTNEKKDEIVEVGFILTDKDLVEKCSGSSALQVSNSGWQRMKETPIVWEMHTENGLIELLGKQNADLPTAREYEYFLITMLEQEEVESHRVMLAGSGVGHFDRRFLAEHMPVLNGYMAYPVIDVGVIRRFYRDLCGMEVSGIDEGKTHRALDDIRCHLDEAKWFRKQFSS